MRYYCLGGPISYANGNNMQWITRIPTHGNDGDPIPPTVRQSILNDVRNAFGGFSLDGPGQGAWEDDEGRVYEEASWVLTVICERGQYAEARDMVREIGRRLDQFAMYFEVRYMDGVEIIDIE